MPSFDLDGYLQRIGFGHLPSADPQGLASLQRAHRLAIPFENFDIRLGRGISLEPDDVFAKLVTRKRGGYCFEHNQLFLRALHALGFEARPLLARVWLFAGADVPPRTHSLSLVSIAGELWIADPGFGGGYAPPMRLLPDNSITGEDGITHRLIEHADHGWMLERKGGGGFVPQYSFTLDPVYPLDLAMSNHWTSTSPHSRFVRQCIASMVLPHGAASLQDRHYSRTSRTDSVASDITSPRMLQIRLSLVFGLDFSKDDIAALGLF